MLSFLYNIEMLSNLPYAIWHKYAHVSRLFKFLKNGVHCASGIRSLPKRDKLMSRLTLAYTCVDQIRCGASIPSLQSPHDTCVYEVLKGLRRCRTCATILYDHDRLQRASHRLKQGLLRVFRGIFVFHCRFPFRGDSYTR